MASILNLIPRIPHHCFWEITDACNLRCIHCEADAGTRSPDELSTEQSLVFCETLKEAGCEHVLLTGGEPLVRGDWPQIARRIADLGMNASIITNGMLVDDQMVSQMIDAGVTAVSVSIDGNEEVHDAIRVGPGRSNPSSYRKAIGALGRLGSSELKTAAITQVHRRNINDLPRMYDQMVELGVDIWQVQLCMPLGRLMRLRHEYLIEPRDVPKLVRTLVQLIKKDRLTIAVADNIGYYTADEPLLRGSLGKKHGFWTGCTAGCLVVAICANGDVKGCPSHPRNFVVGNITRTSFMEIWGDQQRFDYNTSWREELLEGKCATCEFRRICRAGCTTLAYSVTGTIYDNPFCAKQVE